MRCLGKIVRSFAENDHRVVEKGGAVCKARLAFAEWSRFNDGFFVPWTNQYRVVVDDRVRNSAAEPKYSDTIVSLTLNRTTVPSVTLESSLGLLQRLNRPP